MLLKLGRSIHSRLQKELKSFPNFFQNQHFLSKSPPPSPHHPSPPRIAHHHHPSLPIITVRLHRAITTRPLWIDRRHFSVVEFRSCIELFKTFPLNTFFVPRYTIYAARHPGFSEFEGRQFYHYCRTLSRIPPPFRVLLVYLVFLLVLLFAPRPPLQQEPSNFVERWRRPFQIVFVAHERRYHSLSAGWANASNRKYLLQDPYPGIQERQI